MKKFIALAFLILSLALVGCSSEPTLDGSSTKSMTASIAEMKKSLSKEKMEKLKGGIMLYSMKLGASGVPGDQIPERLCNDLDGMTADEAIEFIKDKVS